MGWDKGGRYYTRSRRVNGHVVREYVGGGTLGELAAQLDAIERAKGDAERAALQAERAELAALDGPAAELDTLADLVARAALLAAGFHRHNRGEWRKKRACNKPASSGPDPGEPGGVGGVREADRERG